MSQQDIQSSQSNHEMTSETQSSSSPTQVTTNRNVETSISLSSFEDQTRAVYDHHSSKKAPMLKATGDHHHRSLKKCRSKPFPRAAPWCIASSSVDSGCSDDNLFCNNDSDCTLSTPCWQTEDLDYIRMMKTRMMKLEDTIELMYKKFKLHEDNIDEMQVKLFANSNSERCKRLGHARSHSR